MAADDRLVVVGALAWCGDGRLLVQRRSPTASHGAGKLELAGGKVERGESPSRALARELTEEWGPGAAPLRVGPIAEVVHHVYSAPGPEILLLVYHVDARALGGDDTALSPVEGADVLRIEAGAPPLSEFLDADRPVVAAVAAGRLRCPF